jgi:hypothetical protein
MKRIFIVSFFLAMWFVTTNYLLQLNAWPTWFPQWISAFVCLMAGLSLGATLAIFVLSLFDKMMDRLTALFNSSNASSMPSLKS